MPEPTVLYTDGACSGNPGPGGWAWAVAPAGPFAAGCESHSTNQRMEVTAALEGLRANAGAVEVRSDSTYVVNCFRQRWWEGWLARGWLNSQKKPVANRDLWEPLIDLYRQRKDEVTFTWVKGHGTDRMNDVVDRLAVEAAQTQQVRAGECLPDDGELGPADVIVPGLRASATATGPSRKGDPGLPEGRLLVVAGHRPPELGGYGDNPVSEGVRDRLTEILVAKVQMHPDLRVLTGLQLGAEQIGAEAARAAGVPYVAVQPYPSPDSLWPQQSRSRYAELVAGAERSVLLEQKAPASKQEAGAALGRRDSWLAKQADEAIVVWDGKDPNVGRLVRSLEGALAEDVWIVDPGEFTRLDSGG
jgi:ribonuclease HI